MTRLACYTSTTKRGDYCHVAKNETRVSRRSIIMSGKHAKSFFYQGMNIIEVFRVILYIKIYFAQTRLCIVIVVNRRCDVSNAISSDIIYLCRLYYRSSNFRNNEEKKNSKLWHDLLL